jgi:hypothetical protein
MRFTLTARRSFVARLIMVVLIGAAASDSSWVPALRAQGPAFPLQRRTIFAADIGQVQQTGIANPGVRRQRETDVDLSFLGSIGAPAALWPVAPARSLALNLFADADFTAVLDRVETVSTLGHAWVGRIPGAEGSQVIVGVSAGILTASVDTGSAQYSVRLSPTGRYRIAQVDSSALQPFAPPISPHVQAGAGFETAGDAGDVYDLLFLYTATARTQAGGTAAVNSLVTTSVARVNAAYVASGIETRCRLAAAVEIIYTESGEALTDLGVLRTNPNVQAMRNQYAADVVSLLVSRDPKYSGFGYVMDQNSVSFAPYAYNVVVHYSFLPYVYALAHEIGHNQGAHHEPGNGCPGLFVYSCGYTDTVNRFYTVMSYGLACQTAGLGCTLLNQFSNPDVFFRGVPTGSATQDNARTINNTRVAFANFRQHDQVLLTIQSSAFGTTDPIPGVYPYAPGVAATVLAKPDLYATFVGWSLSASGSANPLTVTMDQDKTILATFRRIFEPVATGRRQLNRSFSQAEYINVLSWTPNPANQGLDIAGYRIYRMEGATPMLLAQVSASTLEYRHRQAGLGQVRYAIAILAAGLHEGLPAFVTVQ